MKAKRLTKLVAVVIAAVVMVGATKIPVRAYYLSTTDSTSVSSDVEGYGRTYISDNRRSAGADTWVEGRGPIQSMTVAQDSQKMREYNSKTEKYKEKEYIYLQNNTGVSAILAASANSYVVGMEARHIIYTWIRQTTTGTMQ